MKPIGLMSSMHKEICHFLDRIEVDHETRIAGTMFRGGTLYDRPVVLVESGMGKVNAAMTASLLYDRFDCGLTAFCGLAGSLKPELLAGDVAIATELIQHDHGDVFETGFRLTQPSIPPNKPSPEAVGYRLSPDLESKVREALKNANLPLLSASELDEGERRPVIHFGRVLTCDLFLDKEHERERLRSRFKAIAVEMEGAALAQVAERFDRPFLVIRSISDMLVETSRLIFPSSRKKRQKMRFALSRLFFRVLKFEAETTSRSRKYGNRAFWVWPWLLASRVVHI
jgi:adenosylhomocysteine nucleosidase